jgi:hypothetical protein
MATVFQFDLGNNIAGRDPVGQAAQLILFYRVRFASKLRKELILGRKRGEIVRGSLAQTVDKYSNDRQHCEYPK